MAWAASVVIATSIATGPTVKNNRIVVASLGFEVSLLRQGGSEANMFQRNELGVFMRRNT
jgi:hypothetical protein